MKEDWWRQNRASSWASINSGVEEGEGSRLFTYRISVVNDINGLAGGTGCSLNIVFFEDFQIYIPDSVFLGFPSAVSVCVLRRVPEIFE